MVPSRRRIVVALLGVVLLASLVATVAARPPPQPLCQVCTETVIDGDDVAESSVNIHVDESGTGHWTVRFALEPNATVDPATLEAAARSSLDPHRGEADPELREVRTNDTTAVVAYDVPQMGHRSVGDVLVVDYFYSHGDGAHWYGVNADRVVIGGPPGTALIEAPPDRSGDRVVLAGEHGEVFERTISRGWYLAFAPDDGVVSRAGTTLGIGVDVARATIEDLPGVAAVPMAILAAFLVACRRLDLASRRVRDRVAHTAAVTAGLSIGVLLTAIASGSGPLDRRVERAVFQAGFGLLTTSPVVAAALGALTAEYLLSTRIDVEAMAPRIVDLATVVAVLAVVAGLPAAGMDTALARWYGTAVVVLAGLLFYPLGLARGRRARVLAATIVATPLLSGLALGPFGSFTSMYLPWLFVPQTLVVGAVGTLAFAAGRARRRDADK